jgi:predicted HAD superfamily Cof-like phosphohydrolase
MPIDDWFPASGTAWTARKQPAPVQPSVAAMLAEFHEAYRRSGDRGYSDIQLRRDLHREEAAELDEALASDDPVAIARELADVVYIAYGTADALDIPLDAVIAEVHAANMRKFPGGRAVLRDDGKVMKPPEWTPPDVAAVLRDEATDAHTA